jgi:hypothetical protein
MNPRREALSRTSLRAKRGSPCPGPSWIVGGSGWWGTQLRGCPPACGLRLYAAALSAPPARSCVQCWYLKCSDYRRWLPRVMRWVAQRHKGGAHRAGDSRGVTQCVALGNQRLRLTVAKVICIGHCGCNGLVNFGALKNSDFPSAHKARSVLQTRCPVALTK